MSTKSNIYMDQTFWDLRLYEGKYIKVVGRELCLSIICMVLEHYDKPEYDHNLIIVSYNISKNDILIQFPEFDLDSYKFIYYDLEHLNVNPNYWMDFFTQPRGYDEIWTMSFDNYECVLKYINPDTKVVPVRYTTYLKEFELNRNLDKRFDTIFLGTFYQDRGKILAELSDFFNNHSNLLIYGKKFYEILDIFEICKFSIDLSAWELQQGDQNQVRIMEMLSIGMPIISDIPKLNYFPGLINLCERNSEDLLNKILNCDSTSNNIERYKEMTYSDEAYHNYIDRLTYNYYNNILE